MTYEGLFILDIQGKEKGLDDAIATISSQIERLKGKVLGSQKMDKHNFERVAGKLDAGFYVNIRFELDPSKAEVLKDQLALNDLIYRQFYLKKPLQQKAEAVA